MYQDYDRLRVKRALTGGDEEPDKIEVKAIRAGNGPFRTQRRLEPKRWETTTDNQVVAERAVTTPA